MWSWVNTPRGLAGLALLVCASSVIDLSRATDSWSIAESAAGVAVIATVVLTAGIRRRRTASTMTESESAQESPVAASPPMHLPSGAETLRPAD